jgi:pentapeptide MXKDX repeat protein
MIAALVAMMFGIASVSVFAADDMKKEAKKDEAKKEMKKDEMKKDEMKKDAKK